MALFQGTAFSTLSRCKAATSFTRPRNAAAECRHEDDERSDEDDERRAA
jgi:hypothetical protein